MSTQVAGVTDEELAQARAVVRWFFAEGGYNLTRHGEGLIRSMTEVKVENRRLTAKVVRNVRDHDETHTLDLSVELMPVLLKARHFYFKRTKAGSVVVEIDLAKVINGLAGHDDPESVRLMHDLRYLAELAHGRAARAYIGCL